MASARRYPMSHHRLGRRENHAPMNTPPAARIKTPTDSTHGFIRMMYEPESCQGNASGSFNEFQSCAATRGTVKIPGLDGCVRLPKLRSKLLCEEIGRTKEPEWKTGLQNPTLRRHPLRPSPKNPPLPRCR